MIEFIIILIIINIILVYFTDFSFKKEEDKVSKVTELIESVKIEQNISEIDSYAKLEQMLKEKIN